MAALKPFRSKVLWRAFPSCFQPGSSERAAWISASPARPLSAMRKVLSPGTVATYSTPGGYAAPLPGKSPVTTARMPQTAAFESSVFKSRREEVLRRMRELAPGPAVAILPGMPVATRNSDVEHAYRAHSDVYWLTRFEEPESVAVLSTQADRPFTLFVRPRDKEKEIWTGRRAGTEGAIKTFGADQAFEVTKLEEELPKLVGTARTLFYRLGGDDPEFDVRVAKLLRTLRARGRAGVTAPPRIEDPGQILHELRLRKEPRELDAMCKAVELTRAGHLACMKAGQAGANEADLHALLEREFRHG